MKIGFFDSGLGGLTILSAVRTALPQYDYIFFGDTKNLPYGDKTEAEIHELTLRGVMHLFDAGALLVIVACNTASARALRKLQDTLLTDTYHDRKILGVIIPTVETILTYTPKRLSIIATQYTIDSKKYDEEIIARSSNQVSIESHATKDLVPLIESGKLDEAYKTLKMTLPVDGVGEVLVLGCTHYTVLKNRIRAEFKTEVISQDEIIPEKLKKYLDEHPEIEKRLTQTGSISIELSERNNEYKIFSEYLESIKWE